MSIPESAGAEVPPTYALPRRGIEEELADARQRLLDLTMRNRLLNYRPSRARSVRVVDEIPREVYDLLVIGSHALEFRGQPGKAAESEGEALFGEARNDDERVSNLWTPQTEEGASTRHTDRYLETPMESETLLKRLFYVKQESDSVLEEQGYSVLYLALGFLVWKESSAAVELFATVATY